MKHTTKSSREETLMTKVSLYRSLKKRTMRFSFSKRQLFTISLLACLLATTTLTVHSGNAQTNQAFPDWTSVAPDFFNLSPATTEPVLTASMVNDRSNVAYVADPFLFRESSNWYMFFEVDLGEAPSIPADIGLATSSDGLHWTYQHIVLDESFHLAYPYVFKWNDTYYMIPETFDQNAVKLYKATNFPNTWTFVANIASGPGYVDSSIFRYNNTWWLFTSDSSNNMRLYYSDNLANPSSWHSHPMNPIISNDASKTRGGGRVVLFNGSTIIRLAQKDDVVYGQSVRAFQVDTLTTTSYAEHEISQSPLVQASGSGWNKDGMHTLDPWWTGNRWLAVVDGVSYSPSEVWSIGIYASPVIQCQLTMSTNYGSVSPGNGTQDIGSTITITATPPTASLGEQYVFLGWSGTGTGSYTGTNNPASITMNGNITETAQWKIQYYLTVTSTYDSPSPVSGWFDTGSSITESVATPVSGGVGTQYVCTGWTGTGSAPASGTASALTFTITAPSNVTWNWKTQYYLTVTSANGTAGGSGWYDSGASAYATVTPLVVPGAVGTQYNFTAWSGDASGATSPSNAIVMNSPKNATANWITQYYLIVYSPFGSPSPVSGWYDSGQNITAVAASPLSGGIGTQYVCTGWTGTGSVPASGSASAVTFTISAASNITWNWKTQYQVSFVADPSTAAATSPSGTNVWQDTGSISIEATSYAGYRFSSWSADTTNITFAFPTLSSTTATINGSGTITANIASAPVTTPTPTYTPTQTVSPTSTPTLSPFPTPILSPSQSPTVGPSSSPSQSPSTGNNASPYLVYEAVGALAVGGAIAVVIAVRAIYKRKQIS